MKRIIIAAAALLAVVPASLGLLGNASFAQSIPVRVPSQASVLDDHGGLRTHAEPGDDNGGQRTHAEPGDDNGGQGTHAEPGDDKVSDTGSRKVDTGVHGSLNGGKDDGSGHS